MARRSCKQRTALRERRARVKTSPAASAGVQRDGKEHSVAPVPHHLVTYLKQTLVSPGEAELPGISWNGVKRAAAGVCARCSSE